MTNKAGLSSTTYLADGGFILSPLPDSDLRTADRRISRTRTLDGGIVLYDSGFSHGDRTLRINLSSSQTLWDRLWTLFQAATLVTLSLNDGCYRGAFAGIVEGDGRIPLRIMLKEKIS